MKILRQERHTVCFIEFEVSFSPSLVLYIGGMITILNLYRGNIFQSFYH